MIYLDFDGVLIDSASEAFEVGRRTVLELTNNKVDEKCRDHFMALRPLVISAWNYNIVFKLLSKNMTLNESYLYLKNELRKGASKEDKKFESLFIEVRRKMADENKNEWISISTPYKFFKDIVPIIEMNMLRFTILSTKDERSIRETVSFYYNKIKDIRILGKMVFEKNNSRKGDIIRNDPCFKGCGIFIDDGYEHIESARNISGLEVLLADWGYSTDDGIRNSVEDVIKKINKYLEKIMPLPFEKKMIRHLIKLRDEYALDGIKAEFEAEGSAFNDLVRLRRVTSSLNIKLHVKIGGVEAVRDLQDCVELGVDGIIAPMVESPFGAKKFVESIKNMQIEKLFHFSINVETASAVERIEEILPQIKNIVHNITIGRTDLSGSYLDAKIKPNSSFITEIVKKIATSAHNVGMTATMGGSINAETITIYNKEQEIASLLHRMETRKVILPTDVILHKPDALKEALTFEELYILSKKEFLDLRVKSEMARLTNLKTRS